MAHPPLSSSCQHGTLAEPLDLFILRSGGCLSPYSVPWSRSQSRNPAAHGSISGPQKSRQCRTQAPRGLVSELETLVTLLCVVT